MCVCVCERERERASEPKRETAKLIKIKGALKPSTHPLFFFWDNRRILYFFN